MASKVARPMLGQLQPDRAARNRSIHTIPALKNRHESSTKTPSVADESAPACRLIPVISAFAHVNDPPQAIHAITSATTACRRALEDACESTGVARFSSG